MKCEMSAYQLKLLLIVYMSFISHELYNVNHTVHETTH